MVTGIMISGRSGSLVAKVITAEPASRLSVATVTVRAGPAGAVSSGAGPERGAGQSSARMAASASPLEWKVMVPGASAEIVSSLGVAATSGRGTCTGAGSKSVETL